MTKPPRDIGASVRTRLMNLARERGQVFDLLLTRYALERLLYRLSISSHSNRFILKGALLVTTWFEDPHRPTRDLDLLGFGDSSTESLLSIWKEICDIQANDGGAFDAGGLRASPIREELEYGGVRLRTTATLARARISVTVDIGFGDAVEPAPEEIDLPVLLDLPAPHLRAYARETVIAEKYQAMVALGRANSRMKDFYDVWVLSKSYEFDKSRLAQALAATFQRRGTIIPENTADTFAPEFYHDTSKRQQWLAFTRDLAVEVPSFETVATEISTFISPFAREARALSPQGSLH